MPVVSESEKIHASVAGGDAVDERDGRMRALVADHRSDSCRTSEDVVHGANPFLEIDSRPVCPILRYLGDTWQSGGS